jgi:hypothetical protein
MMFGAEVENAATTSGRCKVSKLFWLQGTGNQNLEDRFPTSGGDSFIYVRDVKFYSRRRFVMKKYCSWFVFAALFLFFFIPAKATAQDREGQTFTCESRHNRFQSCPISDPQSEVVLVEELGGARCIRGETWGNDANGIWVDRGCRARFQIKPRRDNGPAWWSSARGRRQRGRPGSGACFFKNVNFTGEYFCSPRGSNISQVPLDDEITSIQIYGRASVTIYKDPNFSGPEATTDRSIPDLHRWRMPNNPNLNWDNRISSARVD